MSESSDVDSLSPARSLSPPSALPVRPASTNGRSKAKQPLRGGRASWLSATNRITTFAQPEQQTPEPSPKGKSRQEAIQEYMHLYASGQIARERLAAATGPTPRPPREADADETMQDTDTHPQPAQQYATDEDFVQSREYAAYTAFLRDAQLRKAARHDLALRDLIATEAVERIQTRLAALEGERDGLERKLGEIEGRRVEYASRHAVGISVVEDEREERRWEEWLRVARGVEVGGGGEGGDAREEEEEGGVEI